MFALLAMAAAYVVAGVATKSSEYKSPVGKNRNRYK